MSKLLLSQFIQTLKRIIEVIYNIVSLNLLLQNECATQKWQETDQKCELISDINLCSVETLSGHLENGESSVTKLISPINGRNTVPSSDEDSNSEWTNSDCLASSDASSYDSEISENESEITDRSSFIALTDQKTSMTHLQSRCLNDQTSSSSQSPSNTVSLIEEMSKSDSEYDTLLPSNETFHENDSSQNYLVVVNEMIYDSPYELHGYYVSETSEDDPYYAGMAATDGPYFIRPSSEDDPYVENEDFLYRWLLIQHRLSIRFL